MTQFDPARALSGEYRSADEDQWFRYICDQYAVDEDEYMAQLIELAEQSEDSRANVESTARRIVEQVRDQGDVAHAVDKLLQQWPQHRRSHQKWPRLPQKRLHLFV